MPEAVWRRMRALPLQSSPWISEFHDPQDAARDLQAAFKVLDVGSIRGEGSDGPSFLLRSVSLPIGDLVISSFSGTALHSHLHSESLSFFVLPGRGKGSYTLLGERMDINAGESVGYLPPCEFAVTNSVTAGTLIGFSLVNLQRRLAAIAGEPEAVAQLHPALLRPRPIVLRTPGQLFLVSAVLDALRLIDEAVRISSAPPPAMLGLDDLVLRSIALLLAPEPPPPASHGASSLQRAVDLAMAWMRANLRQPISLTDIEQQVGYSRRSLQAGFRQRLGCGPMQWLRRQRLEAAHGLIAAIASGAELPLTMKQVARQCGYLNLSAFSRDFSSLYGYPPSQLMRSRG